MTFLYTTLLIMRLGESDGGRGSEGSDRGLAQLILTGEEEFLGGC